MARLTIPDEPTSIEFTVTTAQSEFPISFSLFSKADLKVAAGGVNIPQSGFTFDGTLLEGGGYKGGVVRLNTPVSSTSVRILRRIKPVRPSNFQSQNSVPVRSVDMELNKLVAQQQDVMEALADVEKGVVDPDLLAEVVGEAAADRARTTGDNISTANAPTFRSNLHQFWVTPEDFYHSDDPPGDFEPAIRRMLASPIGRKVRWGDNREYVVNDTLTVTHANTSWDGMATIKLHREPGEFIVPLLNVEETAEAFFCSPTMTFDHNAEGVPQPVLGNQLAFGWLQGVIIQSPRTMFGCRILNSWDNGVGVGRYHLSGHGTAASPFVATQEISKPQGVTITTVYGENCGCGVHVGATGAEHEVGRKGAVVNVLTGSDTIVQNVSGRDNYNGFVVDFGGGGEAIVGTLAFTSTKVDADEPFNGSGIDCYVGSGQTIISALKSDNAARLGLAVGDTTSALTINARIHASGREGVRIEGGYITGTLNVSAAGIADPGNVNAVVVKAGLASPRLNMQVLVSGTGETTTAHKLAYYSERVAPFAATGNVDLVASAGTSGVMHSAAGEHVTVASGRCTGMRTVPPPAANNPTSAMFVDGDLSLDRQSGCILMNAYYDQATPTWRFRNNGFAAAVKSEPAGAVAIYLSTISNAAGADAPAVMNPFFNFSKSALNAIVPLRATVPSGSGTVGDFGYAGALEAIATGTNKKVAVAYDNNQDRGRIQAVDAGFNTKPLSLNDAGGAVQLSTGHWSFGPTRMGSYYLWVDAAGRLRIKDGAPSSDTDGVVVGSQS